MKRYEEYKDSGVQWIGKVPSHWKVGELRFAVNIIMGQSPKGEDIKDEGKMPFMQGNAEFTNIYPNVTLYCDTCSKFSRIGDILMSVRAPVGEMNISDKIYGIGRGLCSIKPISITQGFLWYFMQKSKEDFIYYSNGSTFDAITVETLKSFPAIFAPTSEQQSIASFLNAKTKPIDDIISKREKQIELLEEMKSAIISHAVTKGLNPDAKMKDSGIEWMGEIPEGWSIIRLKHLASLYGRIGYRGYTQQDIVPQGEGAITISPSNMVKGHMDFEKCTYLSWTKYNESPEIMIHNNDILLVKTGSTYGKVAIVKNMPLEATINPQIVAIKNIKCNPDLLNYILGTPYVHLQVENTVIGSTIPTISQEKINNYIFAMPPAEEQQAITSYLDTETSKLDARIAKRRRQIELLQEYKQALITDAVTGKIDVREYNKRI